MIVFILRILRNLSLMIMFFCKEFFYIYGSLVFIVVVLVNFGMFDVFNVGVL